LARYKANVYYQTGEGYLENPFFVIDKVNAVHNAR
jgi:hypothetical protein